MTSILDSDAGLAETIEYHRQLGRFVPVAQGGELHALVSRKVVDTVPVPEELTVADYVVGLELLCFQFYVGGNDSSVWVKTPEAEIPEAWDRRSLEIMQAFRGRMHEVVGFLAERDGTTA